MLIRLMSAMALLATAFLLARCQREWDPVPEWTWRIFPMDTTVTRLYAVTDSTYDNSGAIADVFYRKERLTTIQPDIAGRPLRRLETFRSARPDSGFLTDRVWTQYKDSAWGERTQENVRTLVLKFPAFDCNLSWTDPRNIYTWDVNTYNDKGRTNRMYTNLDTTVTIGDKTYEHCVVVANQPNPGPITYYRAYEIYAPNIGLLVQYERKMVFDRPAPARFNPAESFIHYQYLIGLE